jgi:anti-sigma B factor antagonist
MIDIDVREIGTVTVVAPHGDVDMAVADDVRLRLTGLVDDGRARLVLDLAAVMYIDSSGLGALVAAMKHARAAGGDIKVCALEHDVRALFEMTRLDNVLAVHATRQEAVAAWG